MGLLPLFAQKIRFVLRVVIFYIHNVNSIRAKSGDNESTSWPWWVIIAWAASIPSSVMDLIPDVREVKTTYHSWVSWAVRIHIDGCEVVWPVLVRNNAGKINYLLPWGTGESSPKQQNSLTLIEYLSHSFSTNLGVAYPGPHPPQLAMVENYINRECYPLRCFK